MFTYPKETTTNNFLPILQTSEKIDVIHKDYFHSTMRMKTVLLVT